MTTLVVSNKLNDEDMLLRYMDLSKFMYLVHNKKLYFPRADSFDDRYEGYYLKRDYEIAKGISVSGRDGPPSNKGIFETTKSIRESAYLICWTKSQYESMAHWEVYGGKNSVAIATSVGKLRAQLDHPRANSGIVALLEKEIELVEYIDHHSIDDQLSKRLLSNQKNPLRKKNVAFKYEEEVRVIFSHLHQPLARHDYNKKLGSGFDVEVALDDLICDIIVSPKADRWFQVLIVDLMKRYQLSERVKWSKLHLTPYEEVFGNEVMGSGLAL